MESPEVPFKADSEPVGLGWTSDSAFLTAPRIASGGISEERGLTLKMSVDSPQEVCYEAHSVLGS